MPSFLTRGVHSSVVTHGPPVLTLSCCGPSTNPRVSGVSLLHDTAATISSLWHRCRLAGGSSSIRERPWIPGAAEVAQPRCDFGQTPHCPAGVLRCSLCCPGCVAAGPSAGRSQQWRYMCVLVDAWARACTVQCTMAPKILPCSL